MEFYAELRLRGDEYNDGYGNGITLSGSETVRSLEEVSKTENETVFKTKKGHTLRVLHEKKGDVTICRSIFENTSSEDAAIELLSSFAIRDLDAEPKVEKKKGLIAGSCGTEHGKVMGQPWLPYREIRTGRKYACP